MPNHIYDIVFIHRIIGQNKENAQFAPIGPKNKSISSFVAGFKSTVTKRINGMREIPKALVWQRNYYEHIIRNEKSLKKTREYVIYNPQTWENDSLFHY